MRTLIESSVDAGPINLGVAGCIGDTGSNGGYEAL